VYKAYDFVVHSPHVTDGNGETWFRSEDALGPDFQQILGKS